MASFNRVILVGNVTRDLELRHISSGTAVTDMGLAVNDRIKKGEQWVDETTFVDITIWGRTAEIAAEYLSKGSSVLIEGRLKLDSWEKEGQKHSKLKVVCDKMQMLGSRNGSGGGGGRSDGGGSSSSYQEEEPSFAGAPSSGSSGAPPRNDEIPF